MFLELDNLIISKKKGKIPSLPFLVIQKKIIYPILKKKYSLAINFIYPKEAQALNIKYRKKKYIPNILSFPTSKTEGEIFICLSAARKEAKQFDLSYKKFLYLLIIHGCLHLSGVLHGKKMTSLEKKYLKKEL